MKLPRDLSGKDLIKALSRPDIEVLGHVIAFTN